MLSDSWLRSWSNRGSGSCDTHGSGQDPITSTTAFTCYPLEVPQYRNAGHAVYTIVREEGVAALYRGVTLTALRQATNQGE